MTWTVLDQQQIQEDPLRERTCYISGPMRGYDQYNFPAFHAAQAYLEKRGWIVYSPAALDRDIDGFDGVGKWNSTIEQSLRRDFSVICRSGSMFLMRGWENSSGANEELKVARVLKLDIWVFEYSDDEIVGFSPLDGHPHDVNPEVFTLMADLAHKMPPLEIGQVGEIEVRVVDPVTGGEKGSKLPRYDLIPPDALEELAKVYGIGSKKYADRNWERGYAWGLSYAALGRHLGKDMRGEDIDPDGFYHLAAVAWHALALLAFRLRGVGTDDRGPVAQ